MATRFYLTHVAADISPAYGDGTNSPTLNWSNVTPRAASDDANIDRAELSTTRYGAAGLAEHDLADHTAVNSTGGATVEFELVRQYVSPLLTGQTISGNVSGVLRCFESNANLNATLALGIRLVDGVTGAHKSWLLLPMASDLTTSTPPEMALTPGNTRCFNNTSESTTVALTQRTAVAGDRLVVEVGFRKSNTTTSRTATLRFGDSAASDFALSDALSTDLCPWIEFTQTLAFVSTVTETATPVTMAISVLNQAQTATPVTLALQQLAIAQTATPISVAVQSTEAQTAMPVTMALQYTGSQTGMPVTIAIAAGLALRARVSWIELEFPPSAAGLVTRTRTATPVSVVLQHTRTSTATPVSMALLATRTQTGTPITLALSAAVATLTKTATPVTLALAQVQLRTATPVAIAITNPNGQHLRPIADVDVGEWTTNTGATANLYASLNEAVPDDASYVQSPPQPLASPYVVRLGTPLRAQDGNWILRLRDFDDIAGLTVRCTFELMQGATVLQTFGPYDRSDTTPLQMDVQVDPAVVAAFSDWATPLDVRVTATQQ